MNVIPLQYARGAQWTKLIFNAATNPVGALTLLHHGAATRFGPTGQLSQRSDCRRRGRRPGARHRTAWRSPRARAKGANAPGKHRASMLQDVLATRQTEVIS